MNLIAQQALNVSSTTQKAPLGSRYSLNGDGYIYIKAYTALALGAIAVAKLPLIANAACEASTGQELKDAAAFTSALVGAYAKIVAGTKSINDAPNEIIGYIGTGELKVKTAWTQDLTSSETYSIFHPYWVIEAAAAALKPLGVASKVAIGAGEFGWIQTSGFCPGVLVDGTTDAIVVAESIVTSTVSGKGKGLTSGGTTADEADKGGAIIALAASAIAQLIPARLSC